MRERRPDQDAGALPMRRDITVRRRRAARGIMCRQQARVRVQAPRRREGRRCKHAAAAEHLSLERGTEIKSDEAGGYTESVPQVRLRRMRRGRAIPRQEGSEVHAPPRARLPGQFGICGPSRPAQARRHGVDAVRRGRVNGPNTGDAGGTGHARAPRHGAKPVSPLRGAGGKTRAPHQAARHRQVDSRLAWGERQIVLLPLRFFGMNHARGHVANAKGPKFRPPCQIFGPRVVRFKKRDSYTFWAFFGGVR